MSQDAILDQAEIALNNRDPAGAERVLLQQWSDMSRAPADAQHILALVRMAQGRGDEAARTMSSAARAEPNAQRHQIALGHILMQIGNPQEAIQAYTDAARIDRKWPGLLTVLSEAYYRAGRFTDAEQVARESTSAPTTAAFSALSNALRAQGKLDGALAAAEDALRLDRTDLNARHDRGAALLGLNRAQEALQVFESLLADGVDLPVLAINRGAALEALGRKADARAVYDDAARRWPELPNLQDRIASARKRL